MDEPGPALQVLVPAGLAITLAILGMSLTPADFKRVVIVPRGVLIGMANLLVVSPLLGFAVATAYGLEPMLAVGLVLMAAAPGGALSALLTHLSRGATALSVTMTALSSVLALATMPFYLGLAIVYFDADIASDVSLLGIVARLFVITLVPVTIGMVIRARRPDWVRVNEPRFKKLTVAIFVTVVGVAVAAEFEVLADRFAELALATLTLNVAAMSVAYAAARLGGLDRRQTTAVALELGIHNGALAIAVATSIATVLATPAAVYSVFMWFTAGAFARFMWARNRLPRAPAQSMSQSA